MESLEAMYLLNRGSHSYSLLRHRINVLPGVLILGLGDEKRFAFENPVDQQPKNAILPRMDENAYTAHSDLVDSKGKTDAIEVV
jgi:hypothetical protein